MLTPEETTARKIGRIDAALFFLFWVVVLLLLVAHPYGALPAIIFVVSPTSALVGWRGAQSVRLLLQGRASFLRAAIEGFGFACLFLAAVWCESWFSQARAAGTIFEDLSPESPNFWFIISDLGLWLFGFGVAGAIHGVLLLYLNYRLLMANPSFPQTVKKPHFLPSAELKR
jgi:hypothetical protein